MVGFPTAWNLHIRFDPDWMGSASKMVEGVEPEMTRLIVISNDYHVCGVFLASGYPVSPRTRGKIFEVDLHISKGHTVWVRTLFVYEHGEFMREMELAVHATHQLAKAAIPKGLESLHDIDRTLEAYQEVNPYIVRQIVKPGD